MFNGEKNKKSLIFQANFNFKIHFSVAERAMHWQDRVRQALKQEDVEKALKEFSKYQNSSNKDPATVTQERKAKRLKIKKENPDSSATLTPSSSDAGSDTGNASDNEVKMKSL